MSTHANLPGGWRTLRLQAAVRGDTPIELALDNVGVADRDRAEARQALTDAHTAYHAGDTGTALAVATSLGEELQNAKQPGRKAAA